MWCARQHRPIILPKDRPFGGINVLYVRIFLVGNECLAGPDHAKVHITRYQGGFWAITVKYLDIVNELCQFNPSFLELGWISCVEVIAQGQKCDPDNNTGIIQKDHPSRVLRV